jgi:hypothetical protein
MRHVRTTFKGVFSLDVSAFVLRGRAEPQYDCVDVDIDGIAVSHMPAERPRATGPIALMTFNGRDAQALG